MNAEAEPLPRIPYGMAKDIIATLKHGDVITIRPGYWPSFRQAAQSQAMFLSRHQLWNGRHWVMRLKRVAPIESIHHVIAHAAGARLTAA